MEDDVDDDDINGDEVDEDADRVFELAFIDRKPSHSFLAASSFPTLSEF